MADLTWHRLSCDTNQCPEAAATKHHVLLRSSERPEAVVAFTHAEWATLVRAIRAGDVPEEVPL